MWEALSKIAGRFHGFDLAILVVIIGMITLVIKTPKEQMREVMLAQVFIFILGLCLIILRVVFAYFPPG